VYELKPQPELVRYYHAAAGFPTKPSWLKAIKNKKGRCAQIPAIFENLIPRPEEKKDIFTDTPIFDD